MKLVLENCHPFDLGKRNIYCKHQQVVSQCWRSICHLMTQWQVHTHKSNWFKTEKVIHQSSWSSWSHKNHGLKFAININQWFSVTISSITTDIIELILYRVPQKPIWYCRYISSDIETMVSSLSLFHQKDSSAEVITSKWWYRKWNL